MEEYDKKRLGELIVELAKGNAAVLADISSKVEQILKAVGNIYYKNRADIEDAIYNLYLKLYQKAFRFKENLNGYSWIVRMYENSIKSNLRLRQRENQYIKQEISNLKATMGAYDATYIENNLYLQEIFDRLTLEEQKLVVYYHWCRCTIREVAGILHKPRSTICNKLKKLEEKAKKIQNS